MELFIDTAHVEEIKEAATWGFIDGVTTNPSLMAQTGRTQQEVITEICKIIDGPISAEVISTEKDGMIKEAMTLAEIHKNVVIKLPMTIEGIKALKEISKNGVKTNLTLVFSPNQALLAAKNGATYVSPFIGRLDDVGHNGMQLISEIKTIFDNYNYATKVLTASVRNPLHVMEAAMIGSDVATVPFKVLKAMFSHPLTDKGLSAFLSDHQKAQNK